MQGSCFSHTSPPLKLFLWPLPSSHIICPISTMSPLENSYSTFKAQSKRCLSHEICLSSSAITILIELCPLIGNAVDHYGSFDTWDHTLLTVPDQARALVQDPSHQHLPTAFRGRAETAPLTWVRVFLFHVLLNYPVPRTRCSKTWQTRYWSKGQY